MTKFMRQSEQVLIRARSLDGATEVGVPLEDVALEDLRSLAEELGVEDTLEVGGPWEDETL